MTDKIEVKQEDIVAALAHIGFDSIEDLHYWATDNAELKRFDDLAQAFARHRIAAEEKAKAHWLEVAAKVAGGKIAEADDWDSSYWDQACYVVAAAIRSLGEQE